MVGKVYSKEEVWLIKYIVRNTVKWRFWLVRFKLRQRCWFFLRSTVKSRFWLKHMVKKRFWMIKYMYIVNWGFCLLRNTVKWRFWLVFKDI